MSASEGWAPGLDAGGLAAWLATHVPAIEGPLTLEPIAGGQSNPTYILGAPTGRWVLRRKPLGPLLPSAHQIEREFRVLRALAGTRVPVPRALALCEDTDVLGAPFFVMEFLDGRIFADPALPGVTPAERTAMYESAIAILAELHAVDFRAVGLSDYGRSAGYLARQVTRWTKQYTASQTHTIASMDALIDWLPQHIPAEDEAAIAHGDYRIGNLMFHPREPRVIGVLDWELSTIGHPLLDLAYTVLMHHMPREVIALMGAASSLRRSPVFPAATTSSSATARGRNARGRRTCDFTRRLRSFAPRRSCKGFAYALRSVMLPAASMPNGARQSRRTSLILAGPARAGHDTSDIAAVRDAPHWPSVTPEPKAIT